MMPIWMLYAVAFLKKHWLLFVIVALALALLFFVFHAGRDKERAAEDQRTIQVQQHVGDANENAAAARVEDTQQAAQQKEELHDATNNSSGDDARRRAGCVILRQQGRDTTSIPACR